MSEQHIWKVMNWAKHIKPPSLGGLSWGNERAHEGDGSVTAVTSEDVQGGTRCLEDAGNRLFDVDSDDERDGLWALNVKE